MLGSGIDGFVAVHAEDANPWRVAVLPEPSTHVLSSHRLSLSMGSSPTTDMIEREKGGFFHPTTDTLPSVGS
jgi:hypothetical protein